MTSYLYAGVAGYVGRPDAIGRVGVFRRTATGGEWANVLPDVETAPDTYPQMIAQLFTGLFAPAGTPQAVIDTVAEANRRAMTSQSFRARLIEAGFEPVADTPAEAQRFVEAEIERLGPLIRATGFKPG